MNVVHLSKNIEEVDGNALDYITGHFPSPLQLGPPDVKEVIGNLKMSAAGHDEIGFLFVEISVFLDH